jgi:site-specific DNA-methyltransferase (adenine-specific)/modification methylase
MADWPKPDWECEGVRLYRGDCLEILPQLPVSCINAVVTDPPYGIGVNTAWLSALHVQRGKPRCKSDEQLRGDDGTCELGWLWSFPRRIVWGHPYIVDAAATGWLVWDKQPGLDGERTLGQPCEMASTTTWRGFRIVRCLWAGYYRDGSEHRYAHPTQKPLRVMRRCVELAIDTGLVFDPFMGSGTTGVACVQTGRQFVGIEIESKYFDIAVTRIDQEQRQGRMEFGA